MSVIVAKSGVGGGAGGGSPALLLYDENPTAPSPPSAAGDDSIALGSGAQTTPSAPKSLAIGDQSVARHPGAVVQASGRFGSAGDIQHGKYLLRTVTVTDLPTELFFDGTGGTQRLVVPDDSTWTFTITVTAHRTDVSDGHAGYKLEGVIYRVAGAATLAFQGAPVKTVLGESNPAWDINIDADTSSGSLRLRATGESGKIIRWGALVETLEVTN